MLSTLAILFFILIVFDAAFTRRRMRMFGLNVELNPIIKNMCAILGVELGVTLSMVVPAAALTYLLYMTHFQVGLALLIGFRARLTYVQLQSVKFEKQIKEYRAKIIRDHQAALEQAQNSNPPASSALTSVEPSVPLPTKEDDNAE